MLLISCKKDASVDLNSDASLPVACFTVDDTLTVDTSHLFTFTNCSQNGVRFEWDFGDGNFSLIANPTYRYSARGNHLVRLTAYNNDGVYNTVSKVITIGYYSITKIDYHQLYPSLVMPIITRFYSADF